ncbi:MAG: hypothetical protein DHS20C20_09970 [Ardenticatenaceae bacterium]|nr:MAG: hypothetical protein DHS20C20_09970 [Ardenticatenaceae bacterium]
MWKKFWITAVALIPLLFAAAACNGSPPEASSSEISGPAFVLFYTDN